MKKFYNSKLIKCVSNVKSYLILGMILLNVSVSYAQIPVTVSGTAVTTPPLAGSYTSLADALTNLNAISAYSTPGTIVFTCAAGSSETAPPTGLVIGSATLNPLLSATNTVTIIKASGTVTVNAGVGTATPTSAAPDGIISIRGADYITIDGLTLTDGNAANPATMEFGICLFKAGAGDGCNNNTIQNCTINMQRINNAAATSPMIEGAVGILVINSTAIAATTALTPTNGGTLGTNGTNSGNRFYTNVINSGNYGIGISGFAATVGVGPTPNATTFLGDLGNDIGGVGAGTGNTILNYGGGATTSPASGIRANNQWSVNISYNTVDNNNGSGVNHATTLRGIFAQAGTSAAATISNNTVTVRSGATTSGLIAIDNGIGGTALSGNTININNNTIRFSYTTATTGVFNAISNSASAGAVNINTNNIQQLTATNYPSTGTVAVIVGGSPGGTLNVTNNTISNFVMTSAAGGTLRAITASTPTGLYTVTGNTIENLSYTTAASTGSIAGIFNGASATLENVNNNIIRNFSSPTTGTLNGIQNNTVAGTFQCRNNQIYNFFTTAGGVGGFSANGISWSNANVDLSGNIIYAINSTGTTGGTGGTINGITHSGAATVTGNAIYDLSSNSTNAVITGITTAATGTNTVSNNLIGDLRAPNSTGNISISGMLISGGTTNNIFHNTVNIASTTTSATTFGTSAIYFSSATPVNNLRNNVFVNTSTPGPTGGFTAAIRYATVPTSTNFPAANNNNLYYAGVAAANRVIYCEGSSAAPTNGQQTIANYKAYINTTLPVSGRELASVSEVPNFVSTTGSNPITTFLKYDTGVASQIEQGGALGTGITTDYSGTTVRCPGGGCPGTTATPDIGAWEQNGIFLDITSPAILAIAFTTDACNTTSRTITATISDANNVSTGANAPRLYFRKNAGAYFSVAGTLTSGTVASGTWSFNLAYATLGGVVLADVIDYFIVAQDAIGNAGGNPSAGLVLTDVNTVTTPPTTPLTYAIQGIIGGSYNVGAGQTYTTLTAAVNAYNTSCLSSAVTFVLTDTSYSAGETFPISINANFDASAINTLTIKPASAGTSITGAANSALIRLNGANYVTIDGSTSGGSDRSLTISNTSTTTPSVVLIGSVGTTPTTNNALRNCVIINGANTSSAVVISDATVSGNAGLFSNITVHNNDIQRAFIGVFAQGGTTPQGGSNLTYTNNTLNTTGANAIRLAGLYMQGVNGATVSNNTIGNFDNTSGENDTAIWLATGTTNATVAGNTVSNLGMTLTSAFAPRGIVESSGLAISGNIISNNTVTNLTTSGSTAIVGIENNGGGTIIERNKVSGIINSNTSTYGAYGINISANNNAIIRNNFVSNITGDMTGGAAFSTTFGIFGIRIAAGNGHQVYFNSVNLYGPRTGTATTTLLTSAFALVGTASTGCDVRNNIFANNITGGTTSIANVSVYLPSGGTSAMNLTMNNNLYFYGTDAARSGAGQAGTTAGTNFFNGLPALVAYSSTLSGAATNDNASQAFTTAVPFTSATDLHLTTSNDAGVTIPSVPLDIDLFTRTSTPDIGAHEFTPPCTGAVGGTAVATITSFCNTTSSTTIVASGYSLSNPFITYIWQRSADLAFTTPIDIGVASGTYADLNTGVVTATTFYRLKVVCSAGAGFTDFSTIASVTINTIDFANLQFPSTAAICQGATFTAYGQVYEPGITEAAGQGAGIDVEFGVSPLASNTDPSTWTSWSPASFNVQVGNNDEYQFAAGAALPAGTYYYTFRYKLSVCSVWQYGGFPNGFWNGTTINSGVLTITDLPAVPTVAVTAATCTSAATNVLSTYSASLNYTSTPIGLTVGAGGVITGGTDGTSYTITATNASLCSATTASFTFDADAILPTPAVPTVAVTAATCASAATNVLSTYSASLTYTSSPTGLTVGTGGVITGGTDGTSYTITATNASLCSATTASFTFDGDAILPTPAVPTVAVTAATCTSAATNVLSTYSASLTYTSSPTGLTVGTGGVITGGTDGTSYTITATNASLCSATTASFTFDGDAILPTPAVPTVVVTAPTCASAATNVLSTYSASLTYTSTPTGLTVGAGGVITDGTNGTSYTITATNASLCSATTTSFTYNGGAILPTPATPSVSTTAATCSAAGSSTVVNYNASNTYTFSPTGPTVGAGGAITGAVNGTAYTVTASNGGCTSASSASFTNAAQLAAPATPTGNSTQTINVTNANDATIASLVVSPTTGIVWYGSLADAQAGTNPLATTTVLVSGSTYWAVNVGTPCSSAPFAVTATVTLGNVGFDNANFSFYPNPTSSVVNIAYTNAITKVTVMNLLGQILQEKRSNDLEVTVDLSSYPSAAYLIKVESDAQSKIIKVVKK